MHVFVEQRTLHPNFCLPDSHASVPRIHAAVLATILLRRLEMNESDNSFLPFVQVGRSKAASHKGASLLTFTSHIPTTFLSEARTHQTAKTTTTHPKSHSMHDATGSGSVGAV